MTPMTAPETYRQSLIATFDSCPLRARFNLEDVRRTPSPIAARGTLIHRFVHKAVKKMHASGERFYPVDMGMDLMTQVLCQHDVPSKEVVPLTMEQMKWARVIAVKWCENVRLDARRMLAAEERFFADLVLPTGEKVVITGQLDLLLADPPDGLIVTDYKSGYKRPGTPRNMEKAEREGTGLTALGWAQWLIYCYLMFENFPSIHRVIFKEEHLLWGESRQARMERWEMERLKDVLGVQVALLHQAIQEGPTSARWVPTAGPHCALCSNPRACPILEDEHLEIETPEGRQRVAQEWVVAGETKDRRRAILDGIVEVYGPQEVLHSEGRRVVGWDYLPDGKRKFGMFEPRDIPDSPYDAALAAATREAGVLIDE